MQIIPAGEFKAKCLKLMDTVSKTHQEMIITKRGVPVVKIVPVETSKDPFGILKDTIKIRGDIVQCSIDDAWEADQ